MSRFLMLFRLMPTVKNWFAYLLAYARLARKSPFVCRTRSGAKLEFRPGSEEQTAFAYIWLKRSYTPKGFEILKDDIVFDVGAHLGLFTVLAAQSAKQVFAFEPVPENLEATRKNVALNGFKNITLSEKAVAGKSGAEKLYLTTGSTGGHSLVFHVETDRAIYIKTTTLAEFMSEKNIPRIDFLKFNCEGAEYRILFGCPDAILKGVRVISMQCHERDEEMNSRKMRQFLESKGFTVASRAEGDMLYAKRNTE